MKLLDLLFPPRCLLCGALLGKEKDYCPDCRKKAEEAKGLVLKRFGDGAVLDAKYIDSAMAVFDYEDIKESIFRFKFHGAYGMGKGLGELMVSVARRSFPYLLHRPTIVLPVPIHKSRMRQRGFNQAALLAKELADAEGKPMEEAVLRRVKETRAQMELERKEERLSNVKDAFAVTDLAPGSIVLLVDDIYTTGATANQCAKVCKKAGAAEVHVFTLAAARRKD